MKRHRSRAVVLVAFALACPGAFAQEEKPAVTDPALAVAATLRPEGDDFVIAEDGRLLKGPVSLSDTDVTVRPEGGPEQRIPREKVSIAFSGGKRVLRGEETGVRLACLAYLKAAHAERVPSRNLADAEPAAKAEWWKDLLSLADRVATWFPKGKGRYAAAALLAEGLDLGTWDEEAERRALEWEPLAFPFSMEDVERAKLIASWAREIIPLGGQWQLRADGSADESRARIWREEAIALRSRNVLLFSLDKDPKVAGSALRQGELTVRGLETLFGKPEVATADPLEIRLFRDRPQYLSEPDGGSGYAQIWTAGYFSPGEMVSRFYARDKEGGKFDEREFHEVLSHELTHHWIEMRFCAGAEYEGAEEKPESSARESNAAKRATQGGHWIVEGCARFIEDQAVMFKKNGFKFDDPTAECVRDNAAQWRAGFGIPISRYVDITPVEFHNTLSKGREMQVFYDQGGALSFFMMNRRGPAGRKLFVQYLKDVYGCRLEKQSWKRLGFGSAQELETEFKAFLATVK